MREDFINESKFEKLQTSIAEIVRNSNSLNELETDLRSQRCIDFVRLKEYVVKTVPPRREFTIGIRVEGGTIREKVVTIVIIEDDQYEFHEMREAD